MTRAPARSASETSRPHERLAVERLELVEQRQQQHGCELHETDHDDGKDRRRQHPPAIRLPSDQRTDNQRGTQSEHERD
jgi:hypothetical protein